MKLCTGDWRFDIQIYLVRYNFYTLISRSPAELYQACLRPLSTTMAADDLPAQTVTRSTAANPPDKRHLSIFELPPDFFHSCRILASPQSSVSNNLQNCNDSVHETVDPIENDANGSQGVVVSMPRWTCNTCKAQFESLLDQRLHFKADIHRFNVKLTMAGKNIVEEEDFELLTSDSIKNYDVSSISGSEDEGDNEIGSQNQVRNKLSESFRQKLFICRTTGEKVSVWKCLIMNMGENILNENEVIERLKSLTLEPRNNSHLRIVLLASGGHFAGCVFDGDELVAHKTFHRYVVRAKAGKKQSSKDATGRAAHSAGASLRRHNELALKKAEKDAKRKARAKELKKLRKAKEKKAQAEAAKNASKTAENEVNASTSIHKGQSQPSSGLKLSQEEQLRRAQAEEREKRAAAAERRLASLKIQGAGTTTVPSTSEPKSGAVGDIYCSCCNTSLAGKVPFHRYNYKYCSTSCMHVHREILEDG